VSTIETVPRAKLLLTANGALIWEHVKEETRIAQTEDLLAKFLLVLLVIPIAKCTEMQAVPLALISMAAVGVLLIRVVWIDLLPNV